MKTYQGDNDIETGGSLTPASITSDDDVAPKARQIKSYKWQGISCSYGRYIQKPVLQA